MNRNYQKYYRKLRKFPTSLWECTKSERRAYLVLTQGINEKYLKFGLTNCYLLRHLLKFWVLENTRERRIPQPYDGGIYRHKKFGSLKGFRKINNRDAPSRRKIGTRMSGHPSPSRPARTGHVR